MNFIQGQQTGRTVPPQPEPPANISEEQRNAARRTVAQYAIDTEDAIQLMKMLDLMPIRTGATLLENTHIEAFNA